MVIRKLWKFEGAHVVRGCSSERCSKSIHGHSYVVEVFLKAQELDNGFMLYDFGLLKNSIGRAVDMFDHTYVMWSEEEENFKSFVRTNSERWIQLPVSPSAESFSILFLQMFRYILRELPKLNGESAGLDVYSVRVHETVTGYAEAFTGDIGMLSSLSSGNSLAGEEFKDIVFSDSLMEEYAGDSYLSSLLTGRLASDAKGEF